MARLWDHATLIGTAANVLTGVHCRVITTQLSQSDQCHYVLSELEVDSCVDERVGHNVYRGEVECESPPPVGQDHAHVAETGNEIREVGEDEGEADHGDSFDGASREAGVFLGGFGEFDTSSDGSYLVVHLGGGFVNGDEDEDVSSRDDQHRNDVKDNVKQRYEYHLR